MLTVKQILDVKEQLQELLINENHRSLTELNNELSQIGYSVRLPHAKIHIEKMYNLLRICDGLEPVRDLRRVAVKQIEHEEFLMMIAESERDDGYGIEDELYSDDIYTDSIEELADYLGYDGPTDGVSADYIWEITGH